MRNHIIFDFDGTLIDSAPGILATYAEVLSAAGLTPAVPLDQNLVGPPLQPTMSKLMGEQRSNSDPDTIGVAHTPAYADADNTLRALCEHGYTLYLATNKRASPTLALLDKFGWQPYFRRVYCIDSQLPAFADKTAMMRQLLEDNRLSPEHCLYVGDTRGDYLSATACGIGFAAALWGYGDWQDADNQPIRIEGQYMDLPNLSKALQGA